MADLNIVKKSVKDVMIVGTLEEIHETAIKVADAVKLNINMSKESFTNLLIENKIMEFIYVYTEGHTMRSSFENKTKLIDTFLARLREVGLTPQSHLEVWKTFPRWLLEHIAGR